MPTPVETFRHGLSMSSLQPPPSAPVACGQGLRQSTTGVGHRAESNGGTEIANNLGHRPGVLPGRGTGPFHQLN